MFPRCLDIFKRNPIDFLSVNFYRINWRFITVDETWIHWNNSWSNE